MAAKIFKIFRVTDDGKLEVLAIISPEDIEAAMVKYPDNSGYQLMN